jgi:DNA-binding NtrC family response regulator
MRNVRRLINKAARNRLPVLLLGESGTGKEVVARAIHHAQRMGEFIPIDCGAFVSSLVESELFGHVKGSFSGASENKKGLLEMADGGTAFLDEIGDLPLELQVKLLRVLQEGEFRPVGAVQWKSAQFRVIAATHRDLKAAIVSKRFREDLYYRLNVFPIKLPPLRDRREDIPALIQHFLAQSALPGASPFAPVEETMDLLLRYHWPGNVRELKHCVERMAAMQSEGGMELADMPSSLRNFLDAQALENLSDAVEGDEQLPFASVAPRSPVISVHESLRQQICAALAATRGERARAAEMLSISRTTLYRRMKQYGMD